MFAIWDDQKKKLILGRDPIGIKPYYYWKQKDALFFGAEMRFLLVFDGIRREVHLRAIFESLTYKYVPALCTICEDIRELFPPITSVSRNTEPPNCIAVGD